MTNMSDIVWYNSATGKSQIWFMEGNKIVKRPMVIGEDGKDLAVGLPWSIVGAGDFNRNGNADILWHEANSGHSQIWFVDGHRVVRRSNVLAEDGSELTVGLPWRIAAVGNFNQDGNADILWHNASTGHAQIWQMDGNRVKRRPNVLEEDGKALAVGAPWRIVGAGDFDQDGKADILWHNADTGHSQMWFMDGHKVVRRATVLGENGSALTVGLPWRVAGVGNFNQDGKADILWHNADTGRAQICQIDGHRVVRRPMVLGEDGQILEVGQPWRIVGTGVFNPTTLERLASAKIQDYYAKHGGYFSRFGLPIDAGLNAQESPVVLSRPQGGYSADFRGGRLTLSHAGPGDDVVVEWIRKVKIWFVGLECRVRQEGTDEVYGSIGCIVPSTNELNTYHFPDGIEYFSMGPDGTRTVRVEMLIYDGVPADIVLACLLIEHDSGNIDTYKEKIAAAITTAAKTGLAAIGVPAEATAADQGFLGDLSLGIVNAVSGWIGADDDPYTPQNSRIRAREILLNAFTEQVLERSDTPGVVLKYNAEPVIVYGIDQGGDRGEYGFYFRVEPYLYPIVG